MIYIVRGVNSCVFDVECYVGVTVADVKGDGDSGLQPSGSSRYYLFINM